MSRTNFSCPLVSKADKNGKLSAVQVESGAHQCAMGELRTAEAAIYACKDYRVKLGGMKSFITMQGSRLAFCQGGTDESVCVFFFFLFF